MTDFSLRVGIDISAQQVTATWGTTPDDHRPVVEVEQSPKGYQQLIHLLYQTGYEPSHCQVVMEATGTYWMRLAYALHDAGFVVSVVNPVQAHRLAQAQLRRAKTDAIDARLLMELGFKLELSAWTPPPPLYISTPAPTGCLIGDPHPGTQPAARLAPVAGCADGRGRALPPPHRLPDRTHQGPPG